MEEAVDSSDNETPGTTRGELETVSSLAAFSAECVGDDESFRDWARDQWRSMGIPSDQDETVDPDIAVAYMATLSAEASRRSPSSEAPPEEDHAIPMEQAVLRLLDACKGNKSLADRFVDSHLRPQSRAGYVRSSVVQTLVSQVALASIDTQQTPTSPPIEVTRDYDHVTITNAETAIEPMMARYQMALEFPGAGREPTGFERFDKEIALKPSTVTIVAGREGAGKSAFLLQAAASMSVRGPVIYVITEMSQEDVWKRQAACFGHIEKWKLDRPTVETIDAVRITHQWMADHMQLYIVDAAGVPLNDYSDRNKKKQPGLLTIISDLSASMGGARAVIIDNLWGLAHAAGDLSRGMSMTLALGSITKTLREYSGSTKWDCPVVLAHHLNREGAPSTLAKNKDSGAGAPSTENLGGSDQIGFDAEAVILLSKRPAEAVELDEEAFASGNFAKARGEYDVVDLHITKNRNGRPNTTIVTHFYGAQQRFVEVGVAETPPHTVQVERDTRAADAVRAARNSLPPL